MPLFWSQLLMPEFWLIVAAGLVPGGLVVGLAHLRNWHLARHRQRLPVQEKLLRSPGESLRKKLAELEDQLGERLMFTMVLPMICASMAVVQHFKTPGQPASIYAYVFVAAVGFGVLCRQLFRLLDQRRNYRLGLSGELAAGEELNRLMLRGCHVFHDVPNDPYGNIDHVLVTPLQVFAIETKGRRKREQAEGDGEAHRVVFDGRALQFPDGGWDTRCLEQARQQAARLSDWLSKATGEVVPVQPVLALPGWFVDRQGRGEVWVVSGRELKGLYKGRAGGEGDNAQIKRIVHQLDQRCRDVDF